MPVPRRCPTPRCPNHHDAPLHWYTRFGRYATRAHGFVQRYRCRHCGHTLSDQTESLHYYAKLRLPLLAIWSSLLAGASLREVARRYHCTPQALQNALLRLGRQAMVAQLALLAALRPRRIVVYDGLRSFVTSQDYPCDITTVVEAPGETILTMCHSLMRRGGTMRPTHRRRIASKYRIWSPRRGSMSEDIAVLTSELFDYLRPLPGLPAEVRTDEHPLYRTAVSRNAVCRHLWRAGQFSHRCTPSTAPRTINNPLFAVNYVDRLLRHRLKEHTRETIAFGREATMQMHRAWMFAYDHNCRREHRVRRPRDGCHAAHAAVAPEVVKALNREFFTRRKSGEGIAVPETIRRVWMAEIPTPPIRWKKKQRGRSIRVPHYALRDLTGSYQQAC